VTNIQTDIQTDHATPSVAIGRYRQLTLRCGLLPNDSLIITITKCTFRWCVGKNPQIRCSRLENKYAFKCLVNVVTVSNSESRRQLENSRELCWRLETANKATVRCCERSSLWL